MHRRVSVISLVALVSLCAIQGPLHAQCDTTPPTSCDSNQVPTFAAGPVGDTTRRVPGSRIFAAFGFEMQYDSCQVMYRVADFKKNGARLVLSSWCEGQDITDSTDADLGSISRTAAFTLATGNVLTLYREIAWYDPAIREQDPDNYYAKDTLDYVVDLINAGSGARLALLDSIGVLRRTTRGVPTIYGTTELMKIIGYTVPAGLNGIPARIRITPTARGNGDYYFKRTDRWAIDLSNRLSDSDWQDFLDAYGSVLFKRVTRENITTIAASNGMLSVLPNPSQGHVSITYTKASDNHATYVEVYDAIGGRIAVPAYNPPGGNGQETVDFTYSRPGTYFIILFHGDKPVSSQKIVIQP